jgi:hypothetical protein
MTKASRQSLRKDPINIVYLRVVFTIIRTHFPDEPFIPVIDASQSKLLGIICKHFHNINSVLARNSGSKTIAILPLSKIPLVLQRAREYGNC